MKYFFIFLLFVEISSYAMDNKPQTEVKDEVSGKRERSLLIENFSIGTAVVAGRDYTRTFVLNKKDGKAKKHEIQNIQTK